MPSIVGPTKIPAPTLHCAMKPGLDVHKNASQRLVPPHYLLPPPLMPCKPGGHRGPRRYWSRSLAEELKAAMTPSQAERPTTLLPLQLPLLRPPPGNLLLPKTPLLLLLDQVSNSEGHPPPPQTLLLLPFNPVAKSEDRSQAPIPPKLPGRLLTGGKAPELK